MSTEHVVGESVVVPGLKLTDHTFQVCCPQYIRQGLNIAHFLTVHLSPPVILHVCFNSTCTPGTSGSSSQANQHHQLVCARSHCSEQDWAQATNAPVFARSASIYQALFAARPMTTCLPLLISALATGGPGFEAPRPVDSSSWIKSASSHFRVLLMDQRGTGRSSPITVANLLAKGSAQEQASHLQHFRYCIQLPLPAGLCDAPDAFWALS